MTRKVTFLGTGLMGAHMARNLLAAGIPVTVWNRSSAKAEVLKEDGAIVATSLGQAVADADIVISILSDGPATQSVQADPALRQSLQSGCVWIEMASIKPDEARAQAADLATMKVLHIDAPVSGGTRGAESGTLAIMAGGDRAVFDRVKPVLAAMGRPVLVGPSGAGQLAKLANQSIVAVTIGAVAEATLMLEQGGADPDAVRDALRGGFADSTILQQHGARMSSRDFVPGGLSRLQVKDLDNALEEAASVGLSLPTTQSIRDRFQRFCTEMEGGDLDHSGLYLELRDRNGLKEH
ncbi:MAG: NAD(P)-dependent oxidoreductase [Paracoccaceae bacterium]